MNYDLLVSIRVTFFSAVNLLNAHSIALSTKKLAART
jgi:hypothetical protein